MVSARREGDTVIVFIPGWMSDSEERRWVDEMVRRLERSEERRRSPARKGDDELKRRASSTLRRRSASSPVRAGERRRASLRSSRRTISSTQRVSSDSLIQPGMKTMTVSPSRRALTMRRRRSLRRTSTTAGLTTAPA